MLTLDEAVNRYLEARKKELSNLGHPKTITFLFFKKNDSVSYYTNDIIMLRNERKKYSANDIMVGDIIKNASGEWDKIKNIKYGN